MKKSEAISITSKYEKINEINILKYKYCTMFSFNSFILVLHYSTLNSVEL